MVTREQALEAAQDGISPVLYTAWRRGGHSHEELLRASQHFGDFLEKYCRARGRGATEAEVYEAERQGVSAPFYDRGHRNGATLPEMVAVSASYPLCFSEYLDARSSASHAELLAVIPLGPYEVAGYGKLRDLSATHERSRR